MKTMLYFIVCLSTVLDGCARRADPPTQSILAPPPSRLPTGESSTDKAVSYLEGVMDQYNDKFFVYSDADAAGNHFVTMARIGKYDESKPQQRTRAESILPPMDLFCCDNPPSGVNCIKSTFNPSRSDDWGGWYFLNGVLTGTNGVPTPNWGDCPNAGLNLAGATTLSFLAKAEHAGDLLQFMCFGVGWPPEPRPFRDTLPVERTPIIRLETKWTPYCIPIKGHLPTNVLGGFAWVARVKTTAKEGLPFFLMTSHSIFRGQINRAFSLVTKRSQATKPVTGF